MTTDAIRVWGFRMILGLALVSAVSWSGYTRLYLSGAPERPAAKPLATPENEVSESQATFLAVGDIMLSRGVDRAIERRRDPLLPFRELADVFNAADFSFGNLESPISGNDKRVGKGLVFNAHRNDINGLIKYKFKVVDLANNHALDQGVAGMRYTRSFLRNHGVEEIGVGENRNDAWQPKTITANGIRIGFLAASYTSINDGGTTLNQYVARIGDRDLLRARIARLKTESDIIVVAMHAGVEYTRHPHRSQVDFARAAIDAGADIVIGSHPHWIQAIEQYRGKYIFYSLGNFIFDQRQFGTREGLMLRVTARRSRTDDGKAVRTYLDRIEIIPVVIDRYAVPRRATESESTAILRKIGIADPVLTPGS